MRSPQKAEATHEKHTSSGSKVATHLYLHTLLDTGMTAKAYAFTKLAYTGIKKIYVFHCKLSM